MRKATSLLLRLYQLPTIKLGLYAPPLTLPSELLHKEVKDHGVKGTKTASPFFEAILTRYFLCEHCGYRSVPRVLGHRRLPG